MNTKYKVEIEKFQGPLDLLLQLIEERELDITEISLAEITNAFITHLDKIEELYPEELADFLVIATRLLYLKSRALLPFLEAEVEESAEQLAAHLRMYKEFRDASEALAERVSEGNFSIARSGTAKQLETVEFSPPERVTGQRLAEVYESALDRMQTVIRIPKAAIRKAITLKERITVLADLLAKHKELSFNEIIGSSRDRTEIVITFLAVLELVKSRTVQVDQPESYSDIMISQI